MINLLPPVGNRAVRKEYVARVYIVFAVVVACALLCGSLMLIPTYALLIKQSFTEAQQRSDTSELDKQNTDITAELGRARATVDQLRIVPVDITISDILSHIEADQSAAVSIDGVYVTYKGRTPVISARGSARTRDALQHFIDALRADTFFKTADVPVSDLAENIEPGFTLTLTLPETAKPAN